MDAPLTAGAYRVLAVAEQLAAEHQAGIVGPGELVWALLLLETRAGEWLQQHGIHQELWTDYFPLAAVSEAAVNYGQRLNLPLGTPELMGWIHSSVAQRSSFLHDVLSQAAEYSHSSGGATEIRSEHLLWGLLVAEPVIAAELQRFGLTRDKVAALLSDGVSRATEELAVDFTLRIRENVAQEHQSTFRILDAAGNRAREGLRVVEDYVRFILDDGHLNAALKKWRHHLSQLMDRLPQTALLGARDTPQDVGTTVKTLSEQQRESLPAVLQANCRRLGESLRTLEEFGKVFSPDWASEIERLRYQFYTLEKGLLQTHAARQTLAERNLYLLVTESQCEHGSGPAVRGGLAGGVGIVQLREKELSDRELLTRAIRMREWTHAAGGLFIMNDRPDLALLSGADGVHVGQEELTVRDARRILGPDKLVGVSTHSIEQARRAVLDGADYLGVGPVFPSGTKSFTKFPGLEFVSQVAAEISLPWFAIGGISTENIGQVIAAGARRVAISGAICRSPQPEVIARRLHELLVEPE